MPVGLMWQMTVHDREQADNGVIVGEKRGLAGCWQQEDACWAEESYGRRAWPVRRKWWW